MDGQFFSSWDWWQKLIFILACSIVLIIIAGYIALSIAKRKISKYATLDTKNRTTSKNYSIDDPEMSLGVKTVDGQASTRDVRGYSSRIPSFTFPAMSKHSFSSHHDDLALQGSDNGIGSKFNNQYCRLYGGADLEIGRAISTDVAEESIIVVPPPTPKLHRSKSTRSQSFHTLHVLDEKDETYEVLQSCVDDRDSLPSARRFQMLHKQNRPESPSELNLAPSLGSGRTDSNYQTQEADLSLLNSHRLSHVAETGQLTPRDRRRLGKSPSSNTFSSIGTESSHSCSSNPKTAPVSADNPQSPANGSPFESSKSAEFITLKEIDTHSSYVEPKHAKMYSLPQMSVSNIEIVDLKKENAADASTPIKKDKSPIEGRKVNSGFEVLAHGTFAKQQSKHSTEREKKQNKKQHHNKSSPDLNSNLLRKLRKSVSKGIF